MCYSTEYTLGLAGKDERGMGGQNKEWKIQNATFCCRIYVSITCESGTIEGTPFGSQFSVF